MTDEISTPALALGQRLTVRIHDVALGSDGVGKHDELVVFVPFTAVGEEVEVEITEVKKNFARGKLARIVSAATERVAPECPYFGECGGCRYQHLSYETQLELKGKQVADLFERIGKFPREIAYCGLSTTLPLSQSHHDPVAVEQAGPKIEHRLFALGLRPRRVRGSKRCC